MRYLIYFSDSCSGESFSHCTQLSTSTVKKQEHPPSTSLVIVESVVFVAGRFHAPKTQRGTVFVSCLPDDLPGGSDFFGYFPEVNIQSMEFSEKNAVWDSLLG